MVTFYRCTLVDISFACGVHKGKTASASLPVCAEETALCCLPRIHTVSVTDAVTVGVTGDFVFFGKSLRLER